MSNLVNFNDWLEKNEIIYDPLIDGDDYLILSLKNALENLGLPYNRKSIEYLQNVLNLIDEEKNNSGVVDIETYAYIVTIAFNDPYTTRPIINYLQQKVDKYISEYKKQNVFTKFFDKLKNLFRT
jgi:hypothetical protein